MTNRYATMMILFRIKKKKKVVTYCTVVYLVVKKTSRFLSSPLNYQPSHYMALYSTKECQKDQFYRNIPIIFLTCVFQKNNKKLKMRENYTLHP
jgi:hypothetical protein